jgi:hypothetical protein
MKRIFTWNIFPAYLYYLSQGNYQIFIPVKASKVEGYKGKGSMFCYGSNVTEIPAAEVKNYNFDCILFQSHNNYLNDQYEILSDEQRGLPKVYLEHDPPRGHAVNTHHLLDDKEVMLVHVNHYNKLMWDNNNLPGRVIEPGIIDHCASYTGNKARGLAIMNNVQGRSRSLGFDIVVEVQKHLPIDLVGTGTEEFGLGKIPHTEMQAFMSQYRFFFCPLRYASLSLAVCEAMMAGMPIAGLATTELSTIIKNGVSGFIGTNIHALIEKMELLLEDRELAGKMGAESRSFAQRRFNISRFIAEWESVFDAAIRQSSIHRLSKADVTV